MELTGDMEGKGLRIIQHRAHDHSLVLRESLLGDDHYGGGGHQVHCDGCREPISSSPSSSSSGEGGGGGDFYACPYSDCWYLLHKRCAKLPPIIDHPSHSEHALTLHFFLFRANRCNICHSGIDSFLYRCSDCDFDVHIRCASIALYIQDEVDENNKIHQHPLIPLEMEAHFLCAVCGREHKGKSYLCSTCGFWANQICTSAPTTIDLHGHPHPVTLFRSFRYDYRGCKICNEEVNRAYWGYRCSEECDYSVHVGCWLSWEGAENSNKDIEANLHSKSTSHKIEMAASKEDIILITWPLSVESGEILTQLIKNLSLQGTHKRVNKILRCREDHPFILVNKKSDESKDDQQCDCCAQTISSQFYHCTQCNFSLHEWCSELPNELRCILHPQHSLRLVTQQPVMHCSICYMPTNGFVFRCFTCGFVLDLKCALLPRLIKHRAHEHNLALRSVRDVDFCNACGAKFFICPFFQCEGCNFGVCIQCALLPISVRHRYDKHPFALFYSPINGQPDEYYCEICEEEINSMYWFYHCIKCDQSLHPKCIYPIERYRIVKFGARFKVDCHSHLLSCVRSPKVGFIAPCHDCGNHFTESYMAYECEQCNVWMHHYCVYSDKGLTTSMTPPN